MDQEIVGQSHAREPIHPCNMPVGVIATRLAYTQESGERNLHGLPFNKPTKEKT